MIFYHRYNGVNTIKPKYKTDYYIPRNHILYTPYEGYEQELYREYFYKQKRINPAFKEAAHELCWIYVENKRLDIYTTTSGGKSCWVNVLKEYVFNMYRKWLKKQKGKAP